MKKKKKFLSLLLAVALVLTTGVLPANVAFAAMVSGNVENEETGDGFTWTYDSGSSTLTINGNGVLDSLDSQQDEWWEYLDIAQIVRLTGSISEIGGYVFDSCTEMERIELPDTIIKIGEGAFQNCSSLKSITLPEKLTVITSSMFAGCEALGQITIPDAVTEIKDYAFASCISLETIPITSKVTKIGNGAFMNCTFKNIVVPDTVTELAGAFGGCSQLESIMLPDGMSEIKSDMFYLCTKLKNVEIPETVTKIGEKAFGSCSALESISIPDSVTDIGYSAFSNCTALKVMEMPISLKKIDTKAFENCTSLTDVQFNQGAKNTTLNTIGDLAFVGCTSLTKLTIPQGVNSIGKCAYGYSKYNIDWNNEETIGVPMPDVAIYGVSGTQAEVYATENNIPFYATDVREPQNLTFAQSTVPKAFGDAAFTQTVSNDKTDGGTVTYSSSNPEVASVEQSTGTVTINDVGTARITAVASEVAGKYTSGTASYTITVSPKTIVPTVTVAGPDIAPGAYIFSGTAKRPAVTVKDGETVISGDQYTVTYSNNIDAGEATVKVSPVNGGRYKWSAPAEAHFTISKAEAPRLTYAEITVEAGIEKEFTREICGIPENAKPSCFDLMPMTNEELLKNRTWDFDTGKVTLTTSAQGKAGDKVTMPIIVITKNYENTIANVVINFVDKEIPTISVEDISVTYNGRRIPDEAIKGTATCSGVDVEGTWTFKDGQNLFSAADSGKKAVVFLPTDQRNFASVETVIDVEIKKAVFPINITFEKVTTSGKTLKDITPAVAVENGEFEWNDGDDTPIVANRKYGWTFTPCEPENYEIITGEVIPWIQSSGGGGGGGGTTVEPAEKSNVEPTQSGSTTTADLSGSTTSKDGQTTTIVDKSVAEKLVETAAANKSTEIVISTVTRNESAAARVKAAEVMLAADTLAAIAEKTDAVLVIKTDIAEVKLDNKAAATIAQQAQAGASEKAEAIKLVVAKGKEDAVGVSYELNVVTAGGKTISDFKGGEASVTVKVPGALGGKKTVCVYIDPNGYYHKVECTFNADGTITFTTGHFSTYAIMAEEEAEAAIEDQMAAVKAVRLKLRSELIKTKSGKKGIKLIWTNPSGIKFDGVEIYRSTKKNSGYGKKPIFVSKSSKYTNTSVKSGKKYYYKVRGFVTIDGKRVFTAYSGKAYRIVK